MKRIFYPAAFLLVAAATAQAEPDRDAVTKISDTVGEMTMTMPGDDADDRGIENSLRFEPIQNFDEMFLRDDVVFLMRHGPTDWSKLDEKDVAPGDCADQRVLSDQGRQDMRDLGALLAHNDIRFGRVVVSEWCRNQQTVDEMRTGFDAYAGESLNGVPVETAADLNLLLSLQGARDVEGLRDLVSSWDGGTGEGPLLVVSHFTNIQELTQFSVYEGEILVIDPDRNNRVLGYLRLKTAEPDVGHFDVEADMTPVEPDSAADQPAKAATN